MPNGVSYLEVTMLQAWILYATFYQVVLNSNHYSMITLPDQRNKSNLVELVERVLTECKNSYTMYVYNNATDDLVFADILRHLKVPYEVRSQPSQRKLPIAALSFNDRPVFMLFTDATNSILPIINDAMSSFLLTNRSRILVILDGTPDEEETRALFKSLWTNAILNIVLIAVGEDGSPSVFNYNPYRNEFLVELPVQHPKVSYLPDKVRNLFGHELRILYFKLVPDVVGVFWKGTYIWVGITVELAPVLASYLNATPLIELDEVLTFGVEKFVNESYSFVTGGLELEIMQGTKDLSLQSSFIKPSLQFDYINPFDPQGKVLLIPKASPIPYFLTFFTTQKRIVGFGIIFSVIIVAVALKLVLTVFGIKAGYTDLAYRMFANLMSQGSINVQLTLPVRIILISWGLFCVVLMASISGEIIQSFIVTTYGKDINDPAEALQVTHWEFYTFEGYINNLIMKNVSFQPLFKQRVRGVSKFVLYEKAFNATGHDAFVVSKAIANYVIGRVGEDVYHIIDRTFVELYSFYVKRGSPYFHTLSSFTQKMVSGGFIKHWAQKLTWYEQKRNLNHFPKNSLAFDEFSKILLVLVVGLLISTIAFVYEHAKAYLSKMLASNREG